ncbi:MAG: hypothetical protein DMG35_07325 [Acidobacteria bacterium]|nr:MAG: hypothetical protein DMG35_07325 [Acidobacteriota bacterium]
MPSPLDTLEVSPTQGTTVGKQLAPDDLLALRAMFLLLDAWDRNSKPATLVDMQLKSAQGEPHAQSVSARQRRAR